MDPLSGLKDAIIAEVASDVLKLKEDVSALLPLVTALQDSLPGHFDLLRAGVIDTLEQIDEGIKEAGGERIEFVRGQLSVFIEQAIEKAFSETSDKTNALVAQFEANNNAAAKNLRAQFDEVSTGMENLVKISQKARFPTWIKIVLPIAFVIAIGASSLVSWQIASYKEAVYMNAFMSQINSPKAKPVK